MSGSAPRTWTFPRISTSSSAGSTRGTPKTRGSPSTRAFACAWARRRARRRRRVSKSPARATSAGVNVWSSRRPARMARGTVRSRGVSSPWTRRDGPAFLASTRRISALSTPPSPPRTPTARRGFQFPRRAPSSTRRTRSPPTSPRATAPSPTPRSPRDENAVPFRIFAPRRVTTRTKRPARDR